MRSNSGVLRRPKALSLSLCIALISGVLTFFSISPANAAVSISSLTSTSWQTNTGNALTTSSIYSTYASLGWSPLITSHCDDCNSLLSFPSLFTTSYNGTSYSGAYFGSNTYFTFGAGSSNYSGLSAANPNIPGIHLCAADNSWQLVVYRTENNGNNFRVRYEGTASTGGTGGSPNIIYEVVFYKGASYFDIAVGTNARCTGGTSGATNGSSYIATFPTSNNVANQYFRISSGLAISAFSSAQSTPTNTNSAITYTLTTAETITGFDASDLSNAGTATGCSFAVSGSGTSYSISVSSCSEGTLIPRLLANSVNGAASGVGPSSNTDSSSTITIDRTAPTATVTSATISPTGSTTFQSTETGTGYLVNSSIAVTNIASITSAADSVWNSSTVTTANTNTTISASGLVDGTYKIYAADASGNLSAASTGTITITIPSCTDSGTTVTCSYTGDIQKWVVPTGITSGTFTVTGAAGGGSSGGFGGVVTGTLALTPGQTLYMYVGQAGSYPSSVTTFNGGGSGTSWAGSGGGGSDIRTSTALTNRLVVAGGGGGFGTVAGGNAGFTAGADAASGYTGSTGGGGGTQSAGGLGGTGAASCGAQGGSAGALGIGGNGATASSGGGGGGGGYYGGGGGGSGCNSNPGGGGSGYVHPTLVTNAGSSLAATRTNGSITIIYVAETLATPTGVSATPTGTSPSGTLKSFGVSWSAVTNANSYTVKIYSASSGGSALATVTGISSASTSTTVTTSQYAGMLDKTTYYCSVTAVGNGSTYSTSAESSRASVTTHSAASTPTFSINPSSQSKTVGQSVTFTVSATATDLGTLSYVWKKGSTTVGTNSNSYTFTTTATSDAADYTVVVTNTLNGSTSNATSAAGTLTMASALAFNARSNVTLTAGTNYSGGTAILVTTTGGKDTKSFALTAGTLPTGMTLDSSTGTISGTPTVSGTYAGIKLTVTDGNSATLQMTSGFQITVNTGSQLPIAIATTYGTADVPMSLAIRGGSGTGAVSYSVRNGTNTTCLLSGSLLTGKASTAGSNATCYVTATKAADSGFSVTSSAETTIFFTAYVPVITQSTTCSATGTGTGATGIGTSGCQTLAPVSPLAGDSGAAPKITAISVATGIVGTSVTITGTGFSTVTKVQFGSKSTTTFSATATTITVSVPTGATTGRVMVFNPNGTAMASQIFTVITADTTAPSFLIGNVNTSSPTQITLTFNESLANSGIAPTAFSVLVGGAGRSVSTVAISGTTVTLTLASAVTTGQAVYFTYTNPSDASAIQDAAGNKTATITSTALINTL